MLRKDSCRVRNKVGGPGGMFPWEIFKYSEPRECYFQNSSTSVEAVNKVIFWEAPLNIIFFPGLPFEPFFEPTMGDESSWDT